MPNISKKLIVMMKIGGICNIVGSPLMAILYPWTEPLEGRPVPQDPFWLYSFYFCTAVFGFLYLTIASSPVKHMRFFPVAIAAKMWGVCAIIYAVFAGYGMIPLVGLYDLVFLPCFLMLFRQVRLFSEA